GDVAVFVARATDGAFVGRVAVEAGGAGVAGWQALDAGRRRGIAVGSCPGAIARCRTGSPVRPATGRARPGVTVLSPGGGSPTRATGSALPPASVRLSGIAASRAFVGVCIVIRRSTGEKADSKRNGDETPQNPKLHAGEHTPAERTIRVIL